MTTVKASLPALAIRSKKKRKQVGTVKQTESKSKKRKLTTNAEEKTALLTFAKALGNNPISRAQAWVKCNMNCKTMVILRQACQELSKLLDARLQKVEGCTRCANANAPDLKSCFCGNQRYCIRCNNDRVLEKEDIDIYRCSYCKTPFCEVGKCCVIACENEDEHDYNDTSGLGCPDCMMKTRCGTNLCETCMDGYDCVDCDFCYYG